MSNSNSNKASKTFDSYEGNGVSVDLYRNDKNIFHAIVSGTLIPLDDFDMSRVDENADGCVDRYAESVANLHG